MKIIKNIGLAFLVMLLLVVSVSAGGYAPVSQDDKDGSGTVEISVLCHHNLFSKDMILFNDIAPNDTKLISLDHAGTFDDRLIPGDYTVKLLDGNGGQPETQKFKITEGYLTRVVFIGHAVSNVGKKVEPENPCNDLEITTGDIHRVFFLSWFRVDVVNNNEGEGWTKTDVVITDSRGHIVFDSPVYSPNGESYSFYWYTSNSHRTHNPLEVSVSGTVCHEGHEEQQEVLR